MEKNVKISILNEIYGKLLTPKQYEIIDDYYNQDLSLSEIAQNNQITRQAVRDILKKGEKKLFEYEQNLVFMKKTLEQKKKIEKILLEITKLKEQKLDKKAEGVVLKSIEKNLKDLIKE